MHCDFLFNSVNYCATINIPVMGLRIHRLVIGNSVKLERKAFSFWIIDIFVRIFNICIFHISVIVDKIIIIHKCANINGDSNCTVAFCSNDTSFLIRNKECASGVSDNSAFRENRIRHQFDSGKSCTCGTWRYSKRNHRRIDFWVIFINKTANCVTTICVWRDSP